MSKVEQKKTLSLEGEVFKLFESVRPLIHEYVSNQHLFGNFESQQAIKSRHQQHLSNTLFVNFKKALNSDTSSVRRAIIERGKLKLKDGVEVDFKNLTLKTKLNSAFLFGYFSYLIKWILVLSALLKFWGIKTAHKKNSIAVLYGCINGLVKSQSDIKRISRFTRNNPIQSLLACQVFIFHGSSKYKFCTDNLIISKFPEIYSVSSIAMSLANRKQMLWQHFLGLFSTTANFLTNPGLLAFAHEFADFPVLNELSKQGWVGCAVHTTSNTTSQRLWTHNTKITNNFIYYNICGIHPVHQSDSEPKLARLDYSMLSVVPATHWLWSIEDCLNMDKLYGIKNTKVIGLPTLFYSEKTGAFDKTKKPDFQIVIFDVTPVSADLFNSAVGSNFYYGNASNACKFLDDILSAADALQVELGARIEIALKPKRDSNDKHINKQYLTCLKEFDKKWKNFSILEKSYPLEKLIHDKSVFISRPYTSVAQIAAMMGCFSIFYDASGALVDIDESPKNVLFVKDFKELKLNLKKYLLAAKA